MITPYRSLTVIAALSGCLAPEPSLSEVEQHHICQEWACGQNSPLIEHLGIADLNVDGHPNANGFSLVRFEHMDKAYRMSVYGAEIRGTPLDGGYPIENNGVTGALLRIVHSSGLKYTIRIAEVKKATQYWARFNGEIRYTWSYKLEWMTEGDPTKAWKNICSDPDAADAPGMDKYHSVVFEGDRIDPRRKIVSAGDSTWFNIGCAGHALAKLHLTGHTKAAKYDGLVTTIDQRTTILKMLSGDYCGEGTPFTVAGAKLTWKDDKGWMKYDPSDAIVEAVWTPQGAACLNTPRLEANPTDLGDDTFIHGVEKAILNVCKRPPPCTKQSTGHLFSANP